MIIKYAIEKCGLMRCVFGYNRKRVSYLTGFSIPYLSCTTCVVLRNNVFAPQFKKCVMPLLNQHFLTITSDVTCEC